MISYGRQSITEEDVTAVEAALHSALLTTGPLVEKFEEALTTAVGSQHAVCCSSGTAALHLASHAAGLGPGTCAIVPSLTFSATANAPRLVGAEVTFADVDPNTGLITPQTLTEALTRVPVGVRPAAVLPVHLNGNVADMPGLHRVARDAGLLVIEDACHALATTYESPGANRILRVGACDFSDMAVFSFHPVKTITQGEGGAVTTRDAELARTVVLLRSHGIVRDPGQFDQADEALDASGAVNPWYYELQMLGLNYRQTEIGSALGLSQLRRLDQFAARRRQLASRYRTRLAPLSPVVQPVPTPDYCDPCLHLFAVLIDFLAIGRTRAAVMKELYDNGIQTQVHYIPLHRQPYYRRLYPEHAALPGADSYYARCLSLPLFVDMTDQDLEKVVQVLADAVSPR